MFTAENTEGFTATDLRLLNEALAVLVARGVDESNASDIINNNWSLTGNTVESLTRVVDGGVTESIDAPGEPAAVVAAIRAGVDEADGFIKIER